jgi:hypothetical protein
MIKARFLYIGKVEYHSRTYISPEPVPYAIAASNLEEAEKLLKTWLRKEFKNESNYGDGLRWEIVDVAKSQVPDLVIVEENDNDL